MQQQQQQQWEQHQGETGLPCRLTPWLKALWEVQRFRTGTLRLCLCSLVPPSHAAHHPFPFDLTTHMVKPVKAGCTPQCADLPSTVHLRGVRLPAFLGPIATIRQLCVISVSGCTYRLGPRFCANSTPAFQTASKSEASPHWLGVMHLVN